MTGPAGRGQRRAGFTLIEIVVTGALVLAGLTLLAQTLLHVAASRKLVERRTLVQHEMGNLMERLTADDWTRGTPAWAQKPELSEDARRRLPGAILAVAVDTPAGDPTARRISVTLRSGNPEEKPAGLVSWIYPREAER
ncbi:hypothetical protein EP7_001542 [Isosphaeraceae bacterium EP7]